MTTATRKQILTPAEYAAHLGVPVQKVLVWIGTGQLEAMNAANEPGGKPRWKIFPEAREKFEKSRSSKSRVSPRVPRRQRSERVPDYLNDGFDAE